LKKLLIPTVSPPSLNDLVKQQTLGDSPLCSPSMRLPGLSRCKMPLDKLDPGDHYVEINKQQNTGMNCYPLRLDLIFFL